MARIYVMRDEGVIVVSRRRPGPLRGRPVRRSWPALAEIPPRTGRLPGETTLVFAPPVALGALAAVLAAAEAGVAVGGATLIASTYLTPQARRWLAERRRNRPGNVVLRGDRARSAFDHALGLADRVSETWPALGPLVDPDEAGPMLAEALWQIAAVLSRREELDAVLEPAGFDPSAASVETRSQLSAARAARARVDAEFQRREAALRRAEEAGRDFIREQQMREAVRAADQTLRSMPPSVPAVSARDPSVSTPSVPARDPAVSTPAVSTPAVPAPVVPLPAIAAAPGTALEPASDLAEHTHSVLAAYRELTAGLATD